MNCKIPRLAGEYIHVYTPAPDVFQGPDSKLFKAGERYEEWAPNDFSVVRGKDGWHLIGITHPRPPQFRHVMDRCPDIHDAEWQLFHAFCRCETLREALHPGAFADLRTGASGAPAPRRAPGNLGAHRVAARRGLCHDLQSRPLPPRRVE